MNQIRVTKEFNFEMAHVLWKYDGPCKNIHGHSYKLFVTIIGTPKNVEGDTKNGMVIDFSDLKTIVQENIIKKFDHTLVINSSVSDEFIHSIKKMFDKYYIAKYQPTCENILLDMVDILRSKLPNDVKLFSLKLYETSTSYAEWYMTDN